MKPTPPRAFDLELKKLVKMLRSMSSKVEKQLLAAYETTFRPEPGKVEEIIAKDREINKMEKEIGRFTLHVIALRRPVAIDLIQLLTAQRLAGELERIADYAKHIAKRCDRVNRGVYVKSIPAGIKVMFQTILEMIRDMDYDRKNVDVVKLTKIYNRDEEIDRDYDSLFRELVTYMVETPASVTACAQLLFVGKNLERIGDLISSMAENMYFASTGKELLRQTED